MSWTSPRSWIYGELVTVSMMNEQIRDNGNAIWVGTTAGDMDYYTGATGKSRLGIGTAGQILKVNAGATAPEWGSNKGLSCYGQIATGYVNGNATSYTDIPSATVNIVVPQTVTLFAFASFYMDMTSIGSGHVRWVLDGTNQQGNSFGKTISDSIFVPASAVGLKPGVTAGTKTCKLQYHSDDAGDNLVVGSINGIILGFAE